MPSRGPIPDHGHEDTTFDVGVPPRVPAPEEQQGSRPRVRAVTASGLRATTHHQRQGVRRCVLVCRATERLEPEAREPWDAARCRALRALRRTRRARARHARPADTPQRTGRRPAGV